MEHRPASDPPIDSTDRQDEMNVTRTCAHPDGCPEPHKARGWCDGHYRRLLRLGDIGPADLLRPTGRSECAIDDCPEPHKARGYCSTHYSRLLLHGDPLRVVPRYRPSTGPLHPLWSGDAVSYGGMHDRLCRLKGKASQHFCACGGTAEEWAYDHQDGNEKLGEPGPYSLDPGHYFPMCIPCHRKLDAAMA